MSGQWRIAGTSLVLLLEILTISLAAAQSNRQRVSLDDAVILVDSSEPSLHSVCGQRSGKLPDRNQRQAGQREPITWS